MAEEINVAETTVVEENEVMEEPKEGKVKTFFKSTAGKVVAVGLGLAGVLGGGYALGRLGAKKASYDEPTDYMTYEDLTPEEVSEL